MVIKKYKRFEDAERDLWKISKGRAISDNRDFIKTATKRKLTVDSISDARILLRTIQSLRCKELVPKGVFRFKTFEEADEWMIKMMVDTLVHRRLKT